ncbi:ubiquitin carboxyl-terminal hydrolase 40-like [Saccoglossus kowalevskii]
MRHKLTNSCKLCAQITPQEEDLSTNTIVLNICRRMPDTRSYTPCEEMILDTSKGATPLILKQTIADRLCLQMENLQIAKHWTEQYEWMILDESSLNANVFKNKQGKGKRKNMPKVNLRQGPFYLKDGDTVGVKDIQHDSSNKDDFTTVEDDIGKEKLKKQAEERKLRRMENRLKNDAAGVDDESGSKSKDRKPEVGIHIHVGDFR